jgi:hypothetical protein
VEELELGVLKNVKVLLFSLIFITACGGNTEKYINLSTSELAAEILPFFEMPMTEHTEQNHIEIFSGIDFELAEEITLFQQALTVHLAEIIIVKPKDNQMDEIMDTLQSRQQMLREQLALYPLQTAAAEAMVVGKIHNVAYLICHENAAEAETALLKFINNIK